MNACKLIEQSLNFTQHVINSSLGDMSDADLLVRPVEGANHIAWQIGHLIVAERRLGGQVPDAHYPELPAGFAEKHDRQPTAQQGNGGFGTKDQYVDLFNKTRAATLAAVAKLSDADLDKPATGPGNVSNLGGLLNLVSTHTMMHGGQFSVVRRKLGKPVLF
ncbi:MAG TPA: DinB family protein [Gemmataceae bacterium]|nr:DinB family protein [Gemmataceae bacterium]